MRLLRGKYMRNLSIDCLGCGLCDGLVGPPPQFVRGAYIKVATASLPVKRQSDRSPGSGPQSAWNMYVALSRPHLLRYIEGLMIVGCIVC